MEGRLAALNPNNSISLALFASAVAHSLAAVVDDNARQLLVGDGSGECTMPFALRFEELAKQLMQVFSQRTIADFSLDNSTRECCGEIHFLRIFLLLMPELVLCCGVMLILVVAFACAAAGVL
jgi:hypothetical protein